MFTGTRTSTTIQALIGHENFKPSSPASSCGSLHGGHALRPPWRTLHIRALHTFSSTFVKPPELHLQGVLLQDLQFGEGGEKATTNHNPRPRTHKSQPPSRASTKHNLQAAHPPITTFEPRIHQLQPPSRASTNHDLRAAHPPIMTFEPHIHQS